jgi:hypothetical protein
VEIEDVLRNIISGKTFNRPKEMNAVSTRVVLPFFPPVCSFAPIHCFSSRSDSTMEYQMGAYVVMLYFLRLLFCQLPDYQVSS